MDEIGEPLIALALRLEGDQRFVEIVAALAAHLAHHIGRPAEEGKRLGDAVERGVAGVIEYAFHRDLHRRIEVEFFAYETLVEIYIRYEGSAGVLEQGLNRRNGEDTALDFMRRNVDRVEFGEREGREFCRIVHELPDSAGTY